MGAYSLGTFWNRNNLGFFGKWLMLSEVYVLWRTQAQTWKNTRALLHVVAGTCYEPDVLAVNGCHVSSSLLLTFYLTVSLSPCPLLSLFAHQAAEGGSLRKMLGSERGVVEEWLSEFKVKSLWLCCSRWLMSVKCVPRGHFFVFPEKPHTVGFNNYDDEECGVCKCVHVTSLIFQAFVNLNTVTIGFRTVNTQGQLCSRHCDLFVLCPIQAQVTHELYLKHFWGFHFRSRHA